MTPAEPRGGFPHEMLRDIFEQPEAVGRALADRVRLSSPHVHLDGLGLDDRDLASLSRVSFIACGSSWHAALIGRYLIEEWARLSAEAEIASELCHRRPVVEPGQLAVAISQSGEARDTVAASRLFRTLDTRTVAITGAAGGTLAREADGAVCTREGVETTAAAVKAFTAQLAVVTLLALKIALARGAVDGHFARDVIPRLLALSGLMRKLLERNDAIRGIAESLAGKREFLFVGRGVHYPVALEGALKLKAIGRRHAEGCPGGEMMRGAIGLVEGGTPVIALAPCGPTMAGMARDIQDVKARDAFVVAVVTEGSDVARGVADLQIPIPRAPFWLQPFLAAMPLQLLAYHMAAIRGADVDRPRVHGKSVPPE